MMHRSTKNKFCVNSIYQRVCIVVAILLYTVILFSSCKKTPRFYRNYSNYSEYDIYVYSGFEIFSYPLYPGTSLSFGNSHPIYPDTSLSSFIPARYIQVRKGATISYVIDDELVDDCWTNDTISFFIIDADSISTYGWCLERIDEFILQRYDLSKEDFLTLFREKKGSMSFPPNDAMKNIKMWPPYGYYDSTGHHASNDE